MCLGVWLALLEGASQRHRLIWGRKFFFGFSGNLYGIFGFIGSEQAVFLCHVLFSFG